MAKKTKKATPVRSTTHEVLARSRNAAHRTRREKAESKYPRRLAE
ncbi:hypothetical protein [Deinococcus sp.]|nr:hypothetical protein [Deinococcus sp.]